MSYVSVNESPYTFIGVFYLDLDLVFDYIYAA